MYSNLGLVLTGGGARAAYQVGALRALVEILKPQTSPFSILSGVSAGAINATAIGAGADNFIEAIERLEKIWRSLTPDKVYRTDTGSLFSIGTRWIKGLSAGGVLGANQINYMLDTSPLRTLIADQIPFVRLKKLIKIKKIRGVSVSATNYITGTGISFFDGDPEIKPWVRNTRLGVRETLTLDHVMASSAIPIFFPPVKVNGIHFGDGCIRMSSPLSPAIHMGANKLIAIGVRYLRTHEQTIEINQNRRQDILTVSDIAGVLLNAVFLDSLETDIERLLRINRTLSVIPKEKQAELAQPLRQIPILLLQPSMDLGKMASDQLQYFPKMVRYLLKGLGSSRESGSDLLSYIAFDPNYISKVMDLGYEDTLAKRFEIEAYFNLK